MRAKLKWDKVARFSQPGSTSTVAVNLMEQVPTGYGLTHNRLGVDTTKKSEYEPAFHVVLADGSPASGWVDIHSPVIRFSPYAVDVLVRIGLHGVYGNLYIDDVKFEVCD